MANSDEIRNFCRICLANTTNVVPLEAPINEENSTNNTPLTLLEMLESVMSQKLLINDKLPVMICANCKRLLKDAHGLKIVFEKSQTTLMENFEDVLSTSQMKIEQIAPVELIFSGQKFDLNDVVIVEDKNEENRQNFDGFLSNLGSTVSVVFRNKTNKRKIHKMKSQTRRLQVKVDINEESEELSEKIGFDTQETDLNSDNLKEKNYKCKLCNSLGQSCDDCDSKPNNKTKGNESKERSKKSVKKLYLCDICGHTVGSISKLKYHTEAHFGKKYQCNICHRDFFYKMSLDLHIKSHTNIRQHLCTECGKTFYYSNALVYHMRIHRNERNYVCEICDKRFYMPCALKRHMRIHTDDRPYVCSFCSKGFRSNGEKRKHEMIHRGEKPYKCRFCEKAFVTKFNQSIHHMSHSGPHACDYCQRSFMELDFLRKHIKDKHGDVKVGDNNNFVFFYFLCLIKCNFHPRSLREKCL